MMTGVDEKRQPGGTTEASMPHTLARISGLPYTVVVELKAVGEFIEAETTLRSQAAQRDQKDEKARRRLLRFEAMIKALQARPAAPGEETALLRRLVAAKRHPIWRMSHSHDQLVQIRIILWFPQPETAYLLAVGDKTGQEDLWYTFIAPNAEARVDRILRQVQAKPPEGNEDA